LTIDVLEISAPKPGKTYPDALDHVEFVTSMDLRDMIRLYPDVEFELKALSNDVNSSIEVNFPDGTLVKFHNDTLRNIIALERKEYMEEFSKTRAFE
jgi:predicted metalloenzyme YecM